MRQVESQVLHEDASIEQGSVVSGHPGEVGRCAVAPPHAGATHTDASPMYTFNLSFEELSNVGLDEPGRNSNMQWMVSKASFMALVRLIVCFRFVLRAAS